MDIYCNSDNLEELLHFIDYFSYIILNNLTVGIPPTLDCNVCG